MRSRHNDIPKIISSLELSWIVYLSRCWCCVYYYELGEPMKKSSFKKLIKSIGEVRGMKKYPSWVCRDCGMKASKGKSFQVSTYHFDKCDVCGEELAVTEPRDFYYPKFKGYSK
jgi:hypothetical protein